MSLNKFSSWNMDNIIIVAGTFYEKHTNRHILYNRQNSRQRERERARGRGNVWQRWKHTPQIIIFLSLFWFRLFEAKHFCACDKRASWNYIFRWHTHTEKNCTDHPIFHINLLFILHIGSKWWAIGQCAGIALMLLMICIYIWDFELKKIPLTVGAHKREWWVDIHIHVHTLTAGISVVYYECAGRWWNRHQILSGAQNVGKNLNTSHCNLYQPKSY